MAKSKGGPSPKRKCTSTSSKHIVDVPHEQPNDDHPKSYKTNYQRKQVGSFN
jgi:hypothetical protein